MAYRNIERFALVDVDGLFLAAAGDELDIVEPSGFSSFIRNVKRDDQYFGINAEFGEAESELGFSRVKATGAAYSGHEMMEYFLDEVGRDSNILLRYYRTVSGVEELDYEWTVVFKPTQNDVRILVRVKKEDYGDKLRTRFDTDVNVEATADLDENTVVAASLIEVPLHSRKQTLLVNSDSTAVNNYDDIVSTKNHTSYFTVGFGTPSLLEIDGYLPPYNFVWGNVDPVEITPLISNISFFGNLEMVLTGDLVWVLLIGPSTAYSAEINLIADIYNGSDLVSQTVIKTTNYSGTEPSVVLQFALDSTTDLTLSQGQSVHLYVKLENDLTIGSFSGTADLEIQNCTIDLIYESVIRPTTTTGLLLFDALNQAISRAVGQQVIWRVDNTVAGITGTFPVGYFMKGSVSGAYGTIIYSSGSDIRVNQVVGTFQPGDTVTSHLTLPAASTGTGILLETSSILGNIVKSSIVSPHLTMVLSSNTGDFVVGELVTGDTSFSTGYVVSWNNVSMRLVLHSVEGLFEAEDITSDSASGTVASSRFGNSGYASTNLVTTGRKIRGLDSDLRINIGKLMDFLRARYAIGFQVIEENSQTKVLIERGKDFFQDVKIITLDNVQRPALRSFNEKFFINEFESGYTVFAKENELGSIKGANTQKTQLLPLEKEKRKFSVIAPVVTDDAEIERVRRLEIKQDERDQTDDEIVIIKCQRFNASNTIKPYYYSDPLNATTYIVVNDASNIITLQGFYLKGQIETATTFSYALRFFSTTFTQTVTISSVSFDASLNKTVITTTDAITAPDGTYSGSVFNYFFFDVDVILPERLENASNVTGVDDAYTIYNIDHAPSNFIVQWWSILGSGFSQKADTKRVKFTKGINNIELSKRFLSADGAYTTSQIAEDDDLLLSELNIYNPPIIKPFKWVITCFISYTDWKLIRECLLGLNEDGKNWGYVEFNDNSGNLVKIFPVSIKRNDTTGRTEIEGWEKETPTPDTDTFRLLEDGDIRLLEDGEYRLLES